MALDFREVFARHWAAYLQRHRTRIPAGHLRAAEAILACRTAALGGNLYRCEDCGCSHFAYHSCNHRLCPLCGQENARDWAHRQKAKLLPVPYSLVTFTVPEGLRALFRSHQKLCYKLLFQCSALALQELALEKKYLGASLGFTSILHTWTRKLIYHPHIHVIVPQGGLTPAGAWVRSKSPDYFLPLKKLSIKMRIAMERAFAKKAPELHDAIEPALWRENWNTHIAAVGNGERAIDYSSRYVSQTALSSKRIVADEGRHVTLLYTDSKTGARKSLRLESNACFSDSGPWRRSHSADRAGGRIVHSPVLAACLARRLQTHPLLRLAESGRSQTLRPHPSAAGLEPRDRAA